MSSILFIGSVLFALATGFIVAYVAIKLDLKNYSGMTHRITGKEFGVVGALVVLIALLVTVVWGPDAARAKAAEGYKEFLNGSVTRAWVEETKCTKNGPCVHEYNCEASNHVHVEVHTHGTGDNAYTERHTSNHTHYESCPYATFEYSYFVEYKTIDIEKVTFASHIFAENPEVWPHREQKGIPSDVHRGVPPEWQHSYDRWIGGDSEPVTILHNYTNFILPSEGTLYDAFNESIGGYLEAGLLPEHTQNLREDVLFGAVPQAAKIQFVGGLSASSQEVWVDRLMRFNAVLGPTRQGDLHIVAMPASAVSNPQDYLNALVAYWQSDFGKWGFPKNGIALVLGVGNDGYIVWSRAKTGMPEGNGAMLSAMTLDLKGERFDPDVMLGRNRVKVAINQGKPVLDEDGDPQFSYSGEVGILGKIIFRDYPFKRACMGCNDVDDNGTGYVFLKDSIPVSTGSMVGWFFIVIVLAGALWAMAVFLDPFAQLQAMWDSTNTDRNKYQNRRNNRW